MNGTCGLDVHHESFSTIYLQNVFYMKIRGLQRVTHREWEQNADFSERFKKFPKGLAIEKLTVKIPKMYGSSLIKSVLLSFYHFQYSGLWRLVIAFWEPILLWSLILGKVPWLWRLKSGSSKAVGRLVLGCRPICRRVIALLNSITAVKNHDTLVRVWTHEFLGGTSHLDIGRRQFAVEFVTSVEAVHVLVTHLVPSQTARIAQTHAAFALVNTRTKFAFVGSICTVESVVTQLVQLHTRPISAHKFVSVTVGSWGNFFGLAELCFVLQKVIPDTVTYKSAIPLSHVNSFFPHRGAFGGAPVVGQKDLSFSALLQFLYPSHTSSSKMQDPSAEVNSPYAHWGSGSGSGKLAHRKIQHHFLHIAKPHRRLAH